MAQFETSATLHRMLGYKAAGARESGTDAEGDDEEELEGRYKFCRTNPLQTDALLVDEAAMLDIQLAAATLAALGPKTQLILVGEAFMLRLSAQWWRNEAGGGGVIGVLDSL